MDEELRNGTEIRSDAAGQEMMGASCIDMEKESVIEELEESGNIIPEPLIEIQAEEQPEAIMEQQEDGTWRHTEESPFSPFYVPDREQKKNNGITIALVALLLVCLVGGMIVAVSKLVEAAMGEATAAWEEGSDEIGDFLAELKDGFSEGFDKREPDSPVPDITEMPDIYIPDTGEWENYFDEFGVNPEDGTETELFEYYQPSPDDEYYVELADSIRDDLSYQVDFEFFEHSDEENNVNIIIGYAVLEGDTPNIEYINEKLENGAMYYAEQFNTGYASDLSINVVTYVTYMDEDSLSVVVDENYIYGDRVKVDLYCMNFDLTTGTLLSNTGMIEADGELADAFRDRSNYQNGESSAVSQYSDSEIAGFFGEEDTLILYFTPVGLEIGYNHPDGWITATLKDYEQYLTKF